MIWRCGECGIINQEEGWCKLCRGAWYGRYEDWRTMFADTMFGYDNKNFDEGEEE